MKNIKLNLFKIALLIIIPLLLLGMSNCKKQVKDEIKIGALLPLTGPLSFVGVQEKKALQLYQEENPNVKFIFEDTKGSPKDALAIANNLNDQNIKYYITSISYIVNTVQPVMDKNKSLNMGLIMDTRSEEKSIYCMRLYVSLADEADKLIELTKKENKKSLGILYMNVELADYIINNYIKQKLEGTGIKLYSVSYDFETKDFKNQLLKLSENNIDVLRFLDFGDKINIILKQISELNLFKNTILVSGIETLLSDYKNYPADLKDKFRFTVPNLLFDENNKLIKKYIDKYSENPLLDALFTYEFINLVIPEIIKYGYNNQEKVISSIINKKTYNGIIASYNINSYGGISPIIYWAKIENDKFVYIK